MRLYTVQVRWRIDGKRAADKEELDQYTKDLLPFLPVCPPPGCSIRHAPLFSHPLPLSTPYTFPLLSLSLPISPLCIALSTLHQLTLRTASQNLPQDGMPRQPRRVLSQVRARTSLSSLAPSPCAGGPAINTSVPATTHHNHCNPWPSISRAQSQIGVEQQPTKSIKEHRKGTEEGALSRV